MKSKTLLLFLSIITFSFATTSFTGIPTPTRILRGRDLQVIPITSEMLDSYFSQLYKGINIELIIQNG
jgi:hypothetical protein